MKTSQGIVITALLCSSIITNAETSGESDNKNVDSVDIDNVDFLLSAGLTYGGDELASTSTGGSLKAGGMFYLAAGAMFHIDSSFDLQASYGYHFDELTADNGSAKFKRNVLELLPFYVTETGHRLGVGYTKAKSVKYSDPIGDIPFKDATGLILEFDWPVGNNSYFGVRYVKLSYQDIYDIFEPIDGNYLGLMMHGGF